MYSSPQRRRLRVIVFFVRVLHVLHRVAEKPIEDARSNSSEAANQKLPPRTAQAKQPIRSVRQGQLKQSNQSSRVHQEDKARFSANQIHRTDILRKIYKIGWSESYRPIRSLGQLFNRYITVTFFRESTRSDDQNCISQSYHLDGYLTVINGHSLRRHPQDRMVRP